MKYTYYSPNDFEKNCPCAYFITAYAESVSPRDAFVRFWTGQRLKNEENTYIVTFDVISRSVKQQLEVKCVEHPNKTYTYETLSKTDIL